MALKPDHVEARFLLDAITGANPEPPPEQYVTNMFNVYAWRFEKHLIDDLGYRIPDLLVDAITSSYGEHHRFSRVIDLGCGTGLVGSLIRPFAELLVGVDL